MKIDKYTKIILTVIAVNLTIFSFKTIRFIPEVHAQNTTSSSSCPNYGLVPLNSDGSVTVKLDDQPIKIVLSEIKSWNKLKIDIAEISTTDELEIKTD